MIERIEALTKARGWSISEMLRRVGLNPGAFRDWRNGKASPEKHLSKIAQVLGTSEAYLRGETDIPTPAFAVTTEGDALPQGIYESLTPEGKEIKKITQVLDDLSLDDLKAVLRFAEFQREQKK